ncbi:MAG: TonB family protein [Terracidiphilus sp.]|jgi:protein TonB
MGSASETKYESLDFLALSDETQAGRVKHNGRMGPDTENLPFATETRHPEATEPDSTMANDLLIQPDTESETATAIMDRSDLDLTFGVPIESKPIWVDLYESIRDVFFPPKLPPLKLTSKPIPVPDRMAVKRNPWAFGISASVNVAVVLVLLFIMGKKILETVNKPALTNTPVDITEFKAPKSDISAGGGGGSPDKIEAIKGKIPPPMKTPVISPVIQAPVPSIDIQNDVTIPTDTKLPNFGVSNSGNVKLASGGNGSGTGLGSGNGGGIGSGSGGNFGGGLERVGGRVSPPKAINNVEAEFSDEARKAKYQGTVEVSFIVDTKGYPQNPRVVKPLGMGLDEKAIEAVMKYRFKPAMRDGKTPVAVLITVAVDFRLY